MKTSYRVLIENLRAIIQATQYLKKNEVIQISNICRYLFDLQIKVVGIIQKMTPPAYKTFVAHGDIRNV